jgi:hypothetical protein
VSERPPLPPPARQSTLPILAAVTYLAAVVALWGMTSLVLDRDVIDYQDAGPLLGPAMVVVATLITWLVGWRSRSWAGAFVALFGSYLGMLVVAAIGYTFTRGELSWLGVAAAHFAISPFVVGAAVLSALVVLVIRWIRASR